MDRSVSNGYSGCQLHGAIPEQYTLSKASYMPQGSVRTGQNIVRGDVVIVCDAGGGTTDVNVLKLGSLGGEPTKLDPLLRVEGQAIGSALVDIRVQQLSVSRTLHNQHWWDRGRRYEPAAFDVKLIQGSADLKFQLLQNDKVINNEDDSVEVTWEAAAKRPVPNINDLELVSNFPAVVDPKMPPANSPSETPAIIPQAASPYLQQLNIIDSPVPDFAATLTTRHEHSDENMSYLRTRLPQHPEPTDPTLTRSERTRQSYLTENEFRSFTSESRRRMLRNFDTTRRYTGATAEQENETNGNSYANRIPQRQSLYDWAPVGEDDEENDDWDPPTYRFDVLNRSREHLPLQEQNHFRSIQRSIDAQRAARSRPRREPRDDPSGRASVPYWAESLRNNSSSPRSEQSLSATAALLQSVERHRRYNARARQTMQGFILDRDRLNHEGATSQAASSRIHPSDNARGTSLYSHYLAHSSSSSRDLRAAYRQMFLDNPSLTHLKHMIKYLSDLRHCTTIEECEALAADLDFDTLYETITPHRDTDFIMNLTVLKPPQPNSWLMPGTVFSGSQHSPQESPALMFHRDREHIRRQVASHQAASGRWDFSDTMPASLRQLADAERYVSSLSSSLYSSTSSNINSSSSSALDRWPVRVVLHSVDLDNMTVSGTMSASHIPDKLPPTSPDHKPEGSSMNSFFEGEIIDFQKHSLVTENFRSDGLETDVTYWRNIGPFRDLSKMIQRTQGAEGGEVEEEMVRCLGSRDWLENVLGRDWVLMRWKERCFITASDSGWGLTISGFYYIAMRRATGQIEGLYYDPGSQPYQQLTMMPEGTKEGSDVSIKRRWPSYQFR